MKNLMLLLLAILNLACVSCTDQSCSEKNTGEIVTNTIMSRRSIRKYKPEPVKREQMENVVQCGINAPSGMNKQPWEVRIVDNPDWINGVTEVYKRENPKVLEDSTFVNMFRNAPTIAFIAAPKDGQGQFDCGLLSENMMLSAWSMGIGSCCLGGLINFLTTNPIAKRYVSQLGFSEGYKLQWAIAFGYPDETPDAKERDTTKVAFPEVGYIVPPIIPDSKYYRQGETSLANIDRFVRKSSAMDYYVMETSDANGFEGPVVVYLHSLLGVQHPDKILSWEWTINDLIWYFDLQGVRAKIIVPVCSNGSWDNKLQGIKNIIDQERTIGNNNGDLYILGASLGGRGVWRMVNAYPTLFKGAMPIAQNIPQQTPVWNLTQTKIICSLGRDEGIWMNGVINEINANGGKAKFIHHQEWNHGDVCHYAASHDVLKDLFE